MLTKTNEKRVSHRDMRPMVKFCCLRERLQQLFEKMKYVYGDDCPSWTQVFLLHKKFLEGR